MLSWSRKCLTDEKNHDTVVAVTVLFVQPVFFSSPLSFFSPSNLFNYFSATFPYSQLSDEMRRAVENGRDVLSRCVCVCVSVGLYLPICLRICLCRCACASVSVCVCSRARDVLVRLHWEWWKCHFISIFWHKSSVNSDACWLLCTEGLSWCVYRELLNGCEGWSLQVRPFDGNSMDELSNVWSNLSFCVHKEGLVTVMVEAAKSRGGRAAQVWIKVFLKGPQHLDLTSGYQTAKEKITQSKFIQWVPCFPLLCITSWGMLPPRPLITMQMWCFHWLWSWSGAAVVV